MDRRRMIAAAASRSKPSAPVQGDPFWASVVALLPLHTDLSDLTGLNTWTATGAAAVNTGVVGPFGGGSLNIGATTGAYISIASAVAAFGFDAGDWTVEGYRYRTAAAGGDNAFFDNRTPGQGVAIYGAVSAPATLNNRLSIANNGAIISGSASTQQFAAGTWEHWAVSASGATKRAFIGGVLAWTISDARTYGATARAFIGANNIGTQSADCRLAWMRVTKGVSRYTAAFTPPAAPFPLF